MKRLELVEYQTTPAVRLSAAERDALRTLAPSMRVEPAAGAVGRYDLTPGSWVGTLQLGDLAVEIQPKLPIQNVLFLLAYTHSPVRWQDETFHLDERAGLDEGLAWLFARAAERATRHGALRGYRRREEALAAIRGRVRLAAQLRDHFGRIPPVEVEYDDLTQDLEENRLLKAGLARLTRLRPQAPWSLETARALRAAGRALEGVSAPEYDPASLPSVHFTRLNEHYRPAVALAKLVLRSSSAALRHGGVAASSFLVDLSGVFEDFVVAALRRSLGLDERRFPQGLAGRRLPLDCAGAVRLQPDLSWWENGRCCFVGDVKYKRTGAGGEHPDLYQLLAYATAARVPAGLLVYAAAEAEPASHQVSEAGKELIVTVLDLSRSPGEILEQVETLARRIRSLRKRVSRSTAA